MAPPSHMHPLGQATWPQRGALFGEAGEAWISGRLDALAAALGPALAPGEWSPEPPEHSWFSNRDFHWASIHTARAARPDGSWVKAWLQAGGLMNGGGGAAGARVYLRGDPTESGYLLWAEASLELERWTVSVRSPDLAQAAAAAFEEVFGPPLSGWG